MLIEFTESDEETLLDGPSKVYIDPTKIIAIIHGKRHEATKVSPYTIPERTIIRYGEGQTTCVRESINEVLSRIEAFVRIGRSAEPSNQGE